MKIDRVWAMANKETFKIKPICHGGMKNDVDETERALAKYRRFNTVVITISIMIFILLCIFGGR